MSISPFAKVNTVCLVLRVMSLELDNIICCFTFFKSYVCGKKTKDFKLLNVVDFTVSSVRLWKSKARKEILKQNSKNDPDCAFHDFIHKGLENNLKRKNKHKNSKF